MITYFCKKEIMESIQQDHTRIYENTKDLFLKTVENGYIIPEHQSNKEIIINNAMYFAKYGGVTNEQFEFIEESQIEDGRCNNVKGQFIGASYQDTQEVAEILDDEVIYIGNFRQHPAHFYLENLSRLWLILKNEDYKKMKFAYIGKTKDNCEFFDFFFETLGIPLENIVHITRVTRCKKIIIPEASFKLNLNYHKVYLDIIDKVMSNIPIGKYSKVYFAKLANRSIGEKSAIELFKKNGYQVIYPEKIEMKDKLSILKGCKEFVASNGSNAHFSIFLPSSADLVVLNRSDDIHFVQSQIDNLKKFNITYVDSYCDLLPTWLSTGPFAFLFTDELENWLMSKNFYYNKKDLIIKSRKNSIIFLQKWFETYIRDENLKLIENKIYTKFITPSKVVKFLSLFFDKNNILNKKKYFIRKQLKFLGIKISYKKYLPYILNYKGLLGINKEYVDKMIENFKPQKRKTIKNMVLSMTSFPERMKDVHYAIFSILNQNVQPEKFILWLAKEEFPNGENDIPQTVLQFKKFGLEIKFTDAIRSFKKIVPALKEYPHSILVSADDDIYYRKDWLKKLYESYKKDPTKIYAHRIHEVNIKNNQILPYKEWDKCILTKKPSFLNFPTSVGGILYPPDVFSDEAVNIEHFKNLCPNQDDVWVWAMAILNDKYFINPKCPVNNNSIYVNPQRELGDSGESTLGQTNCLLNENDKQIQNVVEFYKLMNKFSVKL